MGPDLMALSTTEILKRIEENIPDSYRKNDRYSAFRVKLIRNFPLLYRNLYKLYGTREDFSDHLEDVIYSACKMALDQSVEQVCRSSNRSCGINRGSQEEVGAVFYVDLFAGELKNIENHIPYLRDMGITFIHLMPIFETPPGKSDGGYAVSSYRKIDNRYGTMDDLKKLIRILDRNGISLVLDFVLNHTSDQHEWALKAKEGDFKYQNYYFCFKKRKDVDEYAPFLRDIFPQERKGSFTFIPEMRQWVWTTFNSYQWDINYGNPEVFLIMLEEMFFLVRAGVKVLRFDAPAFIWKKKGTGCENLPEVHTLIKAFKSVLNIVAPGVMFLSEAIVHPDDIKKYISIRECELSYNPLLMATLWESLATRKVALLSKSMQRYAALPEGCNWINYVRCHDDIGWTFSDEDAWEAGINPEGHRKFLNDFYTGEFDGSFARGLPFQKNSFTGDSRISGTCASLAGLEKALEEETEIEVDLAVRRILLIHGIILSMSGFPLIYIGDEAGYLNNYSYTDNPAHVRDSRWVHRQKTTSPSRDRNHYSRRIFEGLQKLIQRRKSCSAFGGSRVEILNLQNPHVFGFIRMNIEDGKKMVNKQKRVTVLANFSEKKQHVEVTLPSIDNITGNIYNTQIDLDAYELLWLRDKE